MPSLRQLRHVLAGFLILAGTAFAQQDLRIAPARDRDIAPRLVVTGAVEQPVRLESVSISVELLGGLAQTDVLLVFRNPNRRVLEGELQFPLLAELNAIVAQAQDGNGAERPDTSRIDPRLLRNLPLDLRVVLVGEFEVK